MAIGEISAERLRELRETPKRVTNPQARTKREERHERTDYEVTADAGQNKFRIYLRQNAADAEDFSCGIRWQAPSGETLTLARYNGPSHIHGTIEYECHIHEATERAIQEGGKPERHAAHTDRYKTLHGALHCLLEDFNVSGLDSSPDQPELF